MAIPDFAVYDMEWSPDLTVQFIGYYDGIEFRGFTNLEDFTDFVLTRPARVIYAHSGGSYDVLFMLGPLIGREVKMRGFFSGVALVGLTVSTPAGPVTLADSLFLIQTSVSQLGDWVGLPKQDLDHTVVHPTHIYEPYCFRDCEIVFLAIYRFQETVRKLGVDRRLTVGSTAIALAKHYGGVFPLKGAADRQLTPAFFGGRTEDIVKGKHKAVNCYDINSAYPWAMTKPIPGAFLGTTNKRPEPPYFVRARNVRLSGRHGPLPVRTPEGLYYPVGVIPDALISDVEEQLTDDLEPQIYYSFAPNRALSELVEKLYALRMEGGASALVYKIVANSIYGKFGEKPDKDSLVVRPDQPPKGGAMLSPGVYRVGHYVSVPHRNIATASYITSLCRAKLYGYMDDQTVYVDTDSVWTTNTRTDCGMELGGLKLEKHADDLHILQPKVYKYRFNDPVKGPTDVVRAKGYRNLGSDQFDRLAGGHKVELEPVMHRAKGMLRKGLMHPELREVSKGMHHHAPKRRPDGSSWDFEEIISNRRKRTYGK